MVALVHLLVPYLLHANISVNTSDWKYGPEVIFDMSIDSYGPLLYDLPESRDNFTEGIDLHNWANYNTTVKVKCRPKTRWEISCYFDDPRLVISSIDANGVKRVINDSKSYSDNYPAKTPHYFEYYKHNDIYDELRAYTASSSIGCSGKDLVRIFLDSLRLPAFFTQLRDGTTRLKLRESSTVGSGCITYYNIDSRKLDESLGQKEKKKVYSLVLKEPYSSSSPIEESLIILRDKKDFGTCRMARDTFPNRFSISRSTSQNRIILTKNEFSSTTTTQLIVEESNSFTSRTLDYIEEVVSVRLVDIVPATGPLPVIENATVFGISGHQVYHSFSAKRYLFSQ